jgi:hypothetical protein
MYWGIVDYDDWIVGKSSSKTVKEKAKVVGSDSGCFFTVRIQNLVVYIAVFRDGTN